MQSTLVATPSIWDTAGLPFLLSLFASIVAVVLLWAKEQWRLASRTQHYVGQWDQFTIEGRQEVRDPESCTVEIARPSRWKPDVLRLRARHTPPGQSQVERVWEGDLVIDRNLHTRGVIAWAYTSPPEITEFGIYNVLLHDNGELFVTPALPPLQGDYLRFVLRRVNG